MNFDKIFDVTVGGVYILYINCYNKTPTSIITWETEEEAEASFDQIMAIREKVLLLL